MDGGKTIQKILSIAIVLYLICSQLPFSVLASSASDQFDTAKVPTPILDEHPGYVELYWKAWEMAYDHVIEDADAAQSPFMDEACYDDVIWIWDSCFMTLFNKYASTDYFPGVANLNNFYYPLYDNVTSSQSIWFPDNPNLFAWVEWENYLMTGDTEHVKWLINEKQYLQKHYQMMETAKPGDVLPNCSHSVSHERLELGYTGSNQIVGMDNSPRGRTYGENNILWIDTISQQALSAYYIAKLADVAGNAAVKDTYTGYYNSLKSIINKYYWDETDGFYYDINKNDPAQKDKVKTVASFWPMLAFVPDDAQAADLLAHVNSPSGFGGFVDFPSVSRSDPDFDSTTGAYWRGGVWLPTVYMGVKGLENYGYGVRADEAAEKILEQQYQTYKTVVPHTIWETYAPCSNSPSTEYGNVVRQDFCGWSALGPISLLIENVIGFHSVNSADKVVEWRLHQNGRHGITNFTFGSITTDIVYDHDVITVRSNGSYTLKVNGIAMNITSGVQSFALDGQTVSVPTDLPFDPTPIPVAPANIALHKTATAISFQDDEHSPDKGNDGNGNSMWIASDGDPNNWWMVDLGSLYDISGGTITFENESLWKYRIEVSTDADGWSPLVDMTQNTSTAPTQAFSSSAVGRYVRVVVTECPNDCWTAFRELELYGTSAISNLALNKTSTASSYENTSRSPSCGNDGDDSTMWIAANGDSGNWWMVDLGSSCYIVGSRITFENSGKLWKYYIEGSEDGIEWTTLVDRTAQEDTAQTQAHSFTSMARYIRITITELPYDCWAAFREFEVLGTV